MNKRPLSLQNHLYPSPDALDEQMRRETGGRGDRSAAQLQIKHRLTRKLGILMQISLESPAQRRIADEFPA